MWANRYFAPRFWNDRYWGTSSTEIAAATVIGKPIRRRRGYTGWRRWLAQQQEPKPESKPAEEWRSLLDSAQIELRAAQSARLIEEIALMERVVTSLMDVLDARERIEREDEEDVEAIFLALN